MSSDRELASVMCDMAAVRELLEGKPTLTDDERNVLLICQESFRGLSELVSLYLKHSAGMNLPRGDNYSHTEALAFGAALDSMGVFGHHAPGHQHPGNIEHSISPDLEDVQLADFQQMMAGIDGD